MCLFPRYNPNRYRDDDDDSDMEANFDEILKEERRRLVTCLVEQTNFHSFFLAISIQLMMFIVFLRLIYKSFI